MKNFSSDLLAFLASSATDAAMLADLFVIAFPSGLIQYCTSGQMPILWNSNLYSPTHFGIWSRGDITTELGTGSNSCDMTIIDNQSVLFPGTSSTLLSAISLGLFDGAQITVLRAFMPINDYGHVIGVETMFAGIMGEIKTLGIASCTFTVRSIMYLLNIQMPRNIMSSGCRHILYDPGCTLQKSVYAEGHTVAAGSTPLILNLNTASAYPLPNLEQGFITFVSGPNNGLTRSIRTQISSTQILLSGLFPFPISTGDSFQVYPGCNKTTARCASFGNLIHFAGFPATPAPESVL